MIAGLNDEGLADEWRDYAAPTTGVVVADELEEAVDVLVWSEIVTGNGEFQPEHLRRTSSLVRIHLPGDEPAGAGYQMRELSRQRAAQQSSATA